MKTCKQCGVKFAGPRQRTTFCSRGCYEEFQNKNRVITSGNKYKWALHKYNITVEQYEQMLNDQGGVCASCGGVNLNGKRLSIDHDHRCCPGKTSCGGCICGLLCSACNCGLGFFKDDLAMLNQARKYLIISRNLTEEEGY
jgi:hypothetical protein